MLTRPARDVEPARVVDAVEHGMRLTGYNEASSSTCACACHLNVCLLSEPSGLIVYRAVLPSSPTTPLSRPLQFSLLSLSCSDYLSLPSVGIQIKNRLKDENVALSLPSQVGL